MTIEQQPNITDNKLREYIIVEHKTKIFCITEKETQILKEYKEYWDIFIPPKEDILLKYSLYNYTINL